MSVHALRVLDCGTMTMERRVIHSASVLLTGDAADTAAHHERQTLPPYLDLPATAQSLDNLHRIEESEGVDLVVFAHDCGQTALLRSTGGPPT